MPWLPSIPLPDPPQLQAVVHTFYDKVYAHPWIGQFFTHVKQEQQEVRLARFLAMAWDDQAFPEMQAQFLAREHAHMFITEDLFDLRQRLFAEALREHGHDDATVDQFLRFNENWRPSVVKASRKECKSTFMAIVEHPRPDERG